MKKADFMMIYLFPTNGEDCSGQHFQKALLLSDFCMKPVRLLMGGRVNNCIILFRSKTLLAKLIALMAGFPERPGAGRNMS